MPKQLVWSKVWPKKQGFYWFYGWMFGKCTEWNGKDPKDKPELRFVKVAKSGNNVMMYITNGHFMYKTEGHQGLWAVPDLPELPNLEG